MRALASIVLVGFSLACGASPAPSTPETPVSAAGPTAPASAGSSVASQKDERTKIHELIALVRRSGMVFIRNGSEHDATAAADHLASKVKNADDVSMTARDFIDRLASVSSFSGDPYLVRLPDGKTSRSRDWLLARLAEIESAP